MTALAPTVPAFSDDHATSYFDLAVSTARQHARQFEEQTHWIDFDAPVVSRGRAQASCGSVVDVDRFSRTPSCLGCRQQQAIADTFRF
jgi:hypothetical protein